MIEKKYAPNKLSSYFRREMLPLTFVTVSGLIYNIGLTAGPYFEGQLAQKLFDILGGSETVTSMVMLALAYIAVIAMVQGARCVKRFYVRRFANDTGRSMRHVLYNHLVHRSASELRSESTGDLMTKAIADVDACAEGMRKFVTEVFDTGIAMIAYLVMMLALDWRLTLISCAFIPVAYFLAERAKILVVKYASAFRKTQGKLNDATLERISGAMTYRVFGRESNRDEAYEINLGKYERAAVMANIWENTMQPLYNIVATTGVLFILFFGGRNVLGSGWQAWNIASFTAFLSCFVKMSTKTSKSAKLFNNVQKAQVSWRRIKPLLSDEVEVDRTSSIDFGRPTVLEVKGLSMSYGERPVFSGLSLLAKPGEIIGVTGPVACGKSTLGRAFICEDPYGGSIELNGTELNTLTDYERSMLISYMGHDPELLSDTIEANIGYGDEKDVRPFVHAVCLDADIAGMTDGLGTVIGSSGARLSGGQQDRLALARTLYHAKKVVILDDPFSAVDRATEHAIIDNMKELIPDAVIFIISHRVTEFPGFDRIIWMQDGKCEVGTHAELMGRIPQYGEIFNAQQAGGTADED